MILSGILISFTPLVTQHVDKNNAKQKNFNVSLTLIMEHFLSF